MDQRRRIEILIGGGAAVGAAGVLVPGPLSTLYGVADQSPEALYLQRFAATRNLALAALGWSVLDDGAHGQTFLRTAAGLFALDTALIVLSARKGRITKRTALMLLGSILPLCGIALTQEADSAS